MLKLGEDRHELQYPGGCQCGAVRQKRYRIVSLGAPPNLKYLHSKTGRRVDLARVRYGTMQSERRRTSIDVYEPQRDNEISQTRLRLSETPGLKLTLRNSWMRRQSLHARPASRHGPMVLLPPCIMLLPVLLLPAAAAVAPALVTPCGPQPGRAARHAR
jgi:hypothetical protein